MFKPGLIISIFIALTARAWAGPSVAKVEAIYELTTFLSSLPELPTFKHWDEEIRRHIERMTSRLPPRELNVTALAEYENAMARGIGPVLDAFQSRYVSDFDLHYEFMDIIFDWHSWQDISSSSPRMTATYHHYRETITPALRGLAFDAYVSFHLLYEGDSLKEAEFVDALQKLNVVFAWLWPEGTATTVTAATFRDPQLIEFYHDFNYKPLFTLGQRRLEYLRTTRDILSRARAEFPIMNCQRRFHLE